MIGMLIVDDERIDREGVAYLLRQFKLPVEPILASSAAQALTLLREREPDILFTDIRMPGENGIELIRQAQRIRPELTFIIYSAYREFEYARQAMQYGVRHYLLKPMKVEEFRTLMEEVLADCRRDRRERREGQLAQLLLLGRAPEDELTVDGELLLIELSAPLFADAEHPAAQLVEQVLHPELCVSLNEFQAAAIMPGSAVLRERAQEFCRRVHKERGIDATVVLGGAVNTPQQLTDAYARADAALEMRFFSPDSRVLSAGGKTQPGAPAPDLPERSNSIEGCIRRGDKARAIAETRQFFDDLAACGALSPLYIKHLCSNLIHCCAQHDPQLPAGRISAYAERVFRCPSADELREVMVDILDEAIADEDGGQSIIRRVLGFVEQEYMHDISLEQIADRVQLSPSYLSFYFKKETGRNFIKYLTMFRLEKAKELLRTTDIKIVTVSEMVGYLNSSYFCLLFKNHTGKTPAKFREDGE